MNTAMEGLSFTSMWPHASTINTISSSIADQIESNTCPICFELMKSPDFSPILLSPCGHTFCAKCVARHTSIHRKKLRCGLNGPPPCPYCRQPIASQTLNHSLQKMITNILSLQQKLEQVEADKVDFCDYQQAQTRFQILQNELQKSVRTKELPNPTLGNTSNVTTMSYSPLQSQIQHLHDTYEQSCILKQRMEVEIADADDLLDHLHAKENDIKGKIQSVSLENQKVTKELMDAHNNRSVIMGCRDDLVSKMDLIKASMSALEQVIPHL